MTFCKNSIFSPQALLWQNFRNLCAVVGLWMTIWKTSELKKSVTFMPAGVPAKVSLLLISSSPFKEVLCVLGWSLSSPSDLDPGSSLEDPGGLTRSGSTI
jgi:hypothetical protein